MSRISEMRAPQIVDIMQISQGCQKPWQKHQTFQSSTSKTPHTSVWQSHRILCNFLIERGTQRVSGTSYISYWKLGLRASTYPNNCPMMAPGSTSTPQRRHDSLRKETKRFSVIPLVKSHDLSVRFGWIHSSKITIQNDGEASAPNLLWEDKNSR